MMKIHRIPGFEDSKEKGPRSQKRRVQGFEDSRVPRPGASACGGKDPEE